jgi:hypothetical protein
LIELLAKTDFADDPNCQKLQKKITDLHSNSDLLITQECRILIQTCMIEDIIEAFFKNHESLLLGTFNKE